MYVKMLYLCFREFILSLYWEILGLDGSGVGVRWCSCFVEEVTITIFVYLFEKFNYKLFVTCSVSPLLPFFTRFCFLLFLSFLSTFSLFFILIPIIFFFSFIHSLTLSKKAFFFFFFFNQLTAMKGFDSVTVSSSLFIIIYLTKSTQFTIQCLLSLFRIQTIDSSYGPSLFYSLCFLLLISLVMHYLKTNTNKYVPLLFPSYSCVSI